MKLYLINFYETYRADEQGVRAMMEIPNDTVYYKHEIVSEADVELPEGYRLEEFEWGNTVMYGAENAEIVTYQIDGGYKTVLVTSRREELLMYWGTYKYLVEVDGEFHDAVVGIDGIGSFIHRGQEMRVSRRKILESPTPKRTGRGFLLIDTGKRIINDIYYCEIQMTKYKLEPSTQRQGYWVLTDTENEIVILFEEHNFNETQDIKILDDKKLFDSCGDEEPATYIARLLREMSEWAAQRHPDIVFPLSTFMVGKNDDGQITIIRTKYPRFSMTVEDSCDANELAKATSKLSEYLRKRA